MSRRNKARRTAPLYAVALAALLVAAYAAPAWAHHPDKGGKKPIGEVASFDGTTLTVTMTDGTSFASAVADDVKIKIAHRGHKQSGKGYKKPSNGSLEDLDAGAMVLRMKVRCDEVQKLRIRRAPESTETVVATEVTEGEVEAPATEETTDDGCADEAASEEAGSDELTGDAPAEDGTTGGTDGTDLVGDVTDVVEVPPVL